MNEDLSTDDALEHQHLVAEASKRAENAGMQKVDDELFVLDAGVATRSLRIVEDVEHQDLELENLEGGALWLYRARRYRAQLDDKTFSTQAEIAKHKGVSRARMTQIMNLLRLDDTLQKGVLAGNYGFVPSRTLREIANIRGKDAQRRALQEHAVSARETESQSKPKRFQTS